MIGARSYLAICPALVLLFAVTSTAQDHGEKSRPLLVEKAPGEVAINSQMGSYWVRQAADLLAVRYGRILVRCGVIETLSESTERLLLGDPIRLPDSLDAVRRLAALSDSELVELSPEVVLLRSRQGVCDEPLLMTSERVSEIGAPLDPAIDLHALDVKLFQSIGTRVLGSHVLFEPHWNGLVYWASREGQGRELYVLTPSTAYLSPQEPTSVSLSKVAIDGTGKDLTVRRLWGASCGGSVVALELDFDGDGVVDILAFSGDSGSFAGTTPLLVISGATGKRIGELGGDFAMELVITKTSSGLRLRTVGKDSDSERMTTLRVVRSYSLRDGVFVLDKEERGDTRQGFVDPIVRPNATKLDRKVFSADEQLVANYCITSGHDGGSYVRRLRGPIDFGECTGLFPLQRISHRRPERDRDGRFDPSVRVLLDYLPKPVPSKPEPS